MAAAVKAFRALHLRLGTRQAYGGHQRKFVAFAKTIGVDPYLPITEEVLCMAAIDFCRTCKATSLPQYFSAIQKMHTENGFGALPRGDAYKQTVRGLINFFGQVDKVEPKHALTIDDLHGILSQLDLRNFADAAFWSALTTAFFGLLRISEYTDGALQAQHVRTVDQGVILAVPFSKTSLQPVEVRLSSRPDLLCPRRALQHYGKLRGFVGANQPVFVRSKDGDVMTRSWFINKVKSHVKALGHNPDHYAGHSCRRGGCTAMFLAGVPETFIAAHGRWRSLEYRKYLAFVDDTQWRPTALLASKAGQSLPTLAQAAQRVGLPGTRPSVGVR